ncbi:MAG: DNA-binding response regulator [Chryseobacterium sp. 39-10]|nr:response regulator transcription factor [Chryseobacterium sp.]OJV46136.1 MAG: DNA-binding response regulator [Chryseobacterium sp. 39-10]
MSIDINTQFLLADDHSLIRQALSILLEDIGIEGAVSQASNLSQVMDVVKSESIDIAIIDAHFPDGNSMTIIPEIKKINPGVKILVYTGVDEKAQSLKFINAGADGFLSKMAEEEETKQAILQMLETGQYLSPITQALLMSALQNPQLADPLKTLTDRELEIAELYGQGLGNLEIANRLSLKQNTVSTVKKRIFEKLNIENIVELANLLKNYEN